MKFVSEEAVDVIASLNGYGGARNIWDDNDHEQSKEICRDLDHGHFAPRCRTSSTARRTNKYGSVPVLRSLDFGWL